MFQESKDIDRPFIVDRVCDILKKIEYKDWQFQWAVIDHKGLLLWVSFDADGESWTGRKWYVSWRATDSEITQTCLKAVLTAEEHEAREKFLVDGRAVFGPHIDVSFLHSIANMLDARPAPAEVAS